MVGNLKSFLRGRGLVAGALLGAGVLVLAGYALYSGLDVSELIRQYGALAEGVAANPLAASAIGITVYAGLVILLVPGVPLLAIPMGLVFGWGMAFVITMAGTLIGVSVLYGAAGWLRPEKLGFKAGGTFEAISRSLQNGGTEQMLFLRLMPPVPFTLLNVALPALRVPFVAFLLTTFFGMLPRLAAYCFAGEGLRGVVDERLRECAVAVPQCTPDFELSDFVTREIVLATGLLAIVSLVPMVFRYLGKFRRQLPSAE